MKNSEKEVELNKLLIIDDNDTQHELFRCFAAPAANIELLHATTIEQAVDVIEETNPDIVFLDYQLVPHKNCGQTLPRIRDAGFVGKVIVISSSINSTLVNMARDHAADDVADKGEFNFRNFGEKVEHYLQ